jgi:RNA polymerase-interacting CarD/CdnL/TRCF family regulator
MVRRNKLTSVGPTTLRVRETLRAAPGVLASDPDERSKLLRRKLRTGDLLRMAEVVRDLAWRQRTGRANEEDTRLLWYADRELVCRLAAQTGKERAWVRQRVWASVERMVSRFA